MMLALIRNDFIESGSYREQPRVCTPGFSRRTRRQSHGVCISNMCKGKPSMFAHIGLLTMPDMLFPRHAKRSRLGLRLSPAVWKLFPSTFNLNQPGYRAGQPTLTQL